VRFRSPEADFERMIELTPAGFVLDYPDIARLVTTIVRIPVQAISDWDSFDEIVGGALELPRGSRRGVDAWIDCLEHCDELPGDRRYEIPHGTTLTLHLDGLADFAARCAAQHAALIGAVAEVNRRRGERGEAAVLALSGAANLPVDPAIPRRRKARHMPDADVDTEAEFRAKLTPEQYEILRRRGTERPFSGEYVYSKDKGMYQCAACGAELFSSDTKFDSGTGWPSFTEPATAAAVDLHDDHSHGMTRTEVTCKNCGSHLGHVFPDGPREAGGQRYCINSLSLQLEPDADAEQSRP
jgi:peptide-methionine (R)-S-oxide reductase